VVIDAIRDPYGHLVGFVKITPDLTERKAAKEVLRRRTSSSGFSSRVSPTMLSTCSTRTAGVASWKPGAQRIKGYDPEEIIGRHFSRFYTDEDKAAELPCKALQIAASEGRFEKEGWRLRKDGSRFWASVIIDAIRGDDGTLIGSYSRFSPKPVSRSSSQDMPRPPVRA
jgi:PAS domain S-box-containing protein